MNLYLLIEYDGTGVILEQRITGEKLFDILQDELEKELSERKKLVVYKIGDCLIDVS